MNNVTVYAALAVILIVLLVLSFILSLTLARRAICRVIATFREFNATEYSKALPLEAMGLSPRSFFSIRLWRDYKPWALGTLAESGIIRMAQEGSFYLSEDRLNANPSVQNVCRGRSTCVHRPMPLNQEDLNIAQLVKDVSGTDVLSTTRKPKCSYKATFFSSPVSR